MTQLAKKEAIKKLAKSLESADKFADIFDIFCTHFAECDEWKGAGKPIKKPLLKKVIVRAASMKFTIGKNYDYVALHDKKNNLIHGLLNFGVYHSVFFYLPTIDKGMLCVSSFVTGTSDFFRLSLSFSGGNKEDILASEDATEVDIQQSNKTVH